MQGDTRRGLRRRRAPRRRRHRADDREGGRDHRRVVQHDHEASARLARGAGGEGGADDGRPRDARRDERRSGRGSGVSPRPSTRNGGTGGTTSGEGSSRRSPSATRRSRGSKRSTPRTVATIEHLTERVRAAEARTVSVEGLGYQAGRRRVPRARPCHGASSPGSGIAMPDHAAAELAFRSALGLGELGHGWRPAGRRRRFRPTLTISTDGRTRPRGSPAGADGHLCAKGSVGRPPCRLFTCPNRKGLRRCRSTN